jgi:hypothetical protein
VSENYGHETLNTEGWIGDKLFLVTIDTGASVTISIPAITVGLPG